MHHISLEEALAVVKAHGFRVTKPKAATVERPTLNALGKPISTNYDPNYRVKYKTPRCSGGRSLSGSTEYAYRSAIALKHAGNDALIAEVCKRNGVSPPQFNRA